MYSMYVPRALERPSPRGVGASAWAGVHEPYRLLLGPVPQSSAAGCDAKHSSVAPGVLLYSVTLKLPVLSGSSTLFLRSKHPSVAVTPAVPHHLQALRTSLSARHDSHPRQSGGLTPPLRGTTAFDYSGGAFSLCRQATVPHPVANACPEMLVREACSVLSGLVYQ